MENTVEGVLTVEVRIPGDAFRAVDDLVGSTLCRWYGTESACR